MSAFQVHGVSRYALYEQAKKKIEIFQHGYRLTEAQWMADVHWVDKQFPVAKTSALSPRYSSPRFAEDFIEKAKGDQNFRDLHVMALTPTGEIDPKTKLPVTRWMAYNPSMNLQQVA